MRILAFVNRDSSPAYHRLILPLLYMPDIDVKITNDLHTSHFEGVDLFLYNRILKQEAINEINKLRDYHGFRIGVDVDDYWILDETHPYREEYIKNNFVKLQTTQLTNADFVTVTHERLQGAVKPYQHKSNIHVLPNAILQQNQFIEVQKAPHPKGLIRLFWQGSSSHLADIAQLRGVTAALEQSAISKLIEMVLAGYEEDTLIWHEIAKLYTDKGKLKHCLIGPLSYDYYYHVYKEADICLVPLRESLFNSMKSNLKVLEAGNLSLPAIVSKTNPYLNMPVRYAENNKQWFSHIQELVLSSTKRADEGAKLKEYCTQHFNFDKINIERKQIFEQYI